MLGYRRTYMSLDTALFWIGQKAQHGKGFLLDNQPNAMLEMKLQTIKIEVTTVAYVSMNQSMVKW
jgi:hypothetical protein